VKEVIENLENLQALRDRFSRDITVLAEQNSKMLEELETGKGHSERLQLQMDALRQNNGLLVNRLEELKSLPPSLERPLSQDSYQPCTGRDLGTILVEDVAVPVLRTVLMSECLIS